MNIKFVLVCVLGKRKKFNVNHFIVRPVRPLQYIVQNNIFMTYNIVNYYNEAQCIIL